MLRSVSPEQLGYSFKVTPASVEEKDVSVDFVNGRAALTELNKNITSNLSVGIGEILLLADQELSAQLNVTGRVFTYDTDFFGSGDIIGTGEIT